MTKKLAYAACFNKVQVRMIPEEGRQGKIGTSLFGILHMRQNIVHAQ